MNDQVFAMLVYEKDHPLSGLKLVLENQGIRTLRVRNCEQTKRQLQTGERPQLVFTDTELPDGKWADVLALARQLTPATQVIVVSRLVDTPLYLEVLESQAFDFIVPPFMDSDLAHVVRCATWHTGQPQMSRVA
jgi:DNA-binding NtrC family response regulator